MTDKQTNQYWHASPTKRKISKRIRKWGKAKFTEILQNNATELAGAHMKLQEKYPPMNLRILSLNITEEKNKFLPNNLHVNLNIFYVLSLRLDKCRRLRTISRMSNSDSWIKIMSAGNAWEMRVWSVNLILPSLSFWVVFYLPSESYANPRLSPIFSQFCGSMSVNFKLRLQTFWKRGAGWSTGLCPMTNSLYITFLVFNYPTERED